MRKVVFGGAISLDNFIARPDGAVDWLLYGDEAAELMRESWARFDAVIMGHKTYEIALEVGQGGPYPGVETYVASRTLKNEDLNGPILINGDVGDAVRSMKAADGKEICLMGGGVLAQTLFEEGLIDEIGFNIHPVLLGAGVPLFHQMNRQIDLRLKEARPFKNGCVFVSYDVLAA